MEHQQTLEGRPLARVSLALQLGVLAFYLSTAPATAAATAQALPPTLVTLTALAALLLLGSTLIHLTYGRAVAAHPLLPMLTMTCCVGGLGMLLGSMLDSHIAGAVAPTCHASIEHTSMSPATWVNPTRMLNWMNLLMLVSCLPTCAAVSCPWRGCRGLTRRHRYLGHGLCALGMLVGMYAGGYLMGPSLSPALGAQASMHLSMLIGMVVGVAAAWPSASLIVPRKGAAEHDHGFATDPPTAALQPTPSHSEVAPEPST